MPWDETQVERSFDFDQAQVADLRARWRALMELAVWGDLKSGSLGVIPRLRKRLLELGEHLRAFVTRRDWLSQPREQVKSALASSVNLREALLNLERAAKPVGGGDDFARFERELLDFRQRLLRLMEKHEIQWGELLERQYDEPVDDD
ncbi:MAG: hypothetical protein KGJ12_04225 [Gammaproteobacteria bacterium]|nr:hypothetical protein [Gammaproteobacteria bacterium]